MKKSVILIIAIVYLGSVFIVGLLGIKMGLYNKTVYTEEIIYIPEGKLEATLSDDAREVYTQATRTGNAIREVRYKKRHENGFDVYIDAIYEEGITFELKFEVRPDNVTKHGFDYAYEKDKTYSIDPETGEKIGGGNVKFSVNGDGNAVITFAGMDKQAETFDVQVTPSDGANVQLIVRINVRKPTV
ncbi:MAG: hypothetical protein IJU84_06345 [Clostridia bacterium]|nr:hypothetical protein [Clostridia bacterium]MBQ9481764.1 hypothetical protein [Clostridia bacterium]